MLGWAIGFFVAALVAAIFGFGGIASAFSGIAVLLFWVFLALFVLSLLFNTFGGAHAATHSGSGRTFATVALIAAVGHDDVIKRTGFGACAGEPDSDHSIFTFARIFVEPGRTGREGPYSIRRRCLI